MQQSAGEIKKDNTDGSRGQLGALTWNNIMVEIKNLIEFFSEGLLDNIEDNTPENLARQVQLLQSIFKGRSLTVYKDVGVNPNIIELQSYRQIKKFNDYTAQFEVFDKTTNGAILEFLTTKNNTNNDVSVKFPGINSMKLYQYEGDLIPPSAIRSHKLIRIQYHHDDPKLGNHFRLVPVDVPDVGATLQSFFKPKLKGNSIICKTLDDTFAKYNDTPIRNGHFIIISLPLTTDFSQLDTNADYFINLDTTVNIKANRIIPFGSPNFMVFVYNSITSEFEQVDLRLRLQTEFLANQVEIDKDHSKVRLILRSDSHFIPYNIISEIPNKHLIHLTAEYSNVFTVYKTTYPNYTYVVWIDGKDFPLDNSELHFHSNRITLKYENNKFIQLIRKQNYQTSFMIGQGLPELTSSAEFKTTSEPHYLPLEDVLLKKDIVIKVTFLAPLRLSSAEMSKDIVIMIDKMHLTLKQSRGMVRFLNSETAGTEYMFRLINPTDSTEVEVEIIHCNKSIDDKFTPLLKDDGTPVIETYPDIPGADGFKWSEYRGSGKELTEEALGQIRLGPVFHFFSPITAYVEYDAWQWFNFKNPDSGLNFSGKTTDQVLQYMGKFKPNFELHLIDGYDGPYFGKTIPIDEDFPAVSRRTGNYLPSVNIKYKFSIDGVICYVNWFNRALTKLSSYNLSYDFNHIISEINEHVNDIDHSNVGRYQHNIYHVETRGLGKPKMFLRVKKVQATYIPEAEKSIILGHLADKRSFLLSSINNSYYTKFLKKGLKYNKHIVTINNSYDERFNNLRNPVTSSCYISNIINGNRITCSRLEVKAFNSNQINVDLKLSFYKIFDLIITLRDEDFKNGVVLLNNLEYDLNHSENFNNIPTQMKIDKKKLSFKNNIKNIITLYTIIYRHGITASVLESAQSIAIKYPEDVDQGVHSFTISIPLYKAFLDSTKTSYDEGVLFAVVPNYEILSTVKDINSAYVAPPYTVLNNTILSNTEEELGHYLQIGHPTSIK